MNNKSEVKPEKANVFLNKTIDGYDTTVVNKVDYNDDKNVMILNAILDEVHNYDVYDEEDTKRLIAELEYNDYLSLYDDDIYLYVERIEPFTEKEIDKDMFLTIKFPTL